MAGDGGAEKGGGFKGKLGRLAAVIGLAGLVGGTAVLTEDHTGPSGRVDPEAPLNTKGSNQMPVISPHNNEGVNSQAPIGPNGKSAAEMVQDGTAIRPQSPLTPNDQVNNEPTPTGAVTPQIKP